MNSPEIVPQPSSTLVYFNLGNIYLEKGYMENAQLLLTSMQVPPPPPLLLLLLMYQQMYVNVITLDPLYRGAFNNLGNALKEADFFDHAIRRVPAASCASSLSTASHSIPIFLRAWNAALRILPADVDVFANIMYYQPARFITTHWVHTSGQAPAHASVRLDQPSCTFCSPQAYHRQAECFGQQGS